MPSRRQAASGRWTSARGGTGFPSVGVSRLSLSFCTGVPGSPSVLWRRAFKRRACPGQAIPARLQYSRHSPDTSATSDARGRGCITYTAEISSQAAPESHPVLHKFVGSFSTTTCKGSWTVAPRQDCEVTSHGKEGGVVIGQEGGCRSPTNVRKRDQLATVTSTGSSANSTASSVGDSVNEPLRNSAKWKRSSTVAAAVCFGARAYDTQLPASSEENNLGTTNDDNKRHADVSAAGCGTLRSHANFWCVASCRSMGKKLRTLLGLQPRRNERGLT